MHGASSDAVAARDIVGATQAHAADAATEEDFVVSNDDISALSASALYQFSARVERGLQSDASTCELVGESKVPLWKKQFDIAIESAVVGDNGNIAVWWIPAAARLHDGTGRPLEIGVGVITKTGDLVRGSTDSVLSVPHRPNELYSPRVLGLVLCDAANAFVVRLNMFDQRAPLEWSEHWRWLDLDSASLIAEHTLVTAEQKVTTVSAQVVSGTPFILAHFVTRTAPALDGAATGWPEYGAEYQLHSVGGALAWSLVLPKDYSRSEGRPLDQRRLHQVLDDLKRETNGVKLVGDDQFTIKSMDSHERIGFAVLLNTLDATWTVREVSRVRE